MPKYALLTNDNCVGNIIIADSLEDAILIAQNNNIGNSAAKIEDSEFCDMGFVWNGTNFINPSTLLEEPTEEPISE